MLPIGRKFPGGRKASLTLTGWWGGKQRNLHFPSSDVPIVRICMYCISLSENACWDGEEETRISWLCWNYQKILLDQN